MRNYEQAATVTGVLLRERKRRCAHGEWLPWLAANFDGTRMTAHRYIQMADAQAPYVTPAIHLDAADEATEAPKQLPTSVDDDRISWAEAQAVQRPAVGVSPCRSTGRSCG